MLVIMLLSKVLVWNAFGAFFYLKAQLLSTSIDCSSLSYSSGSCDKHCITQHVLWILWVVFSAVPVRVCTRKGITQSKLHIKPTYGEKTRSVFFSNLSPLLPSSCFLSFCFFLSSRSARSFHSFSQLYKKGNLKHLPTYFFFSHPCCAQQIQWPLLYRCCEIKAALLQLLTCAVS